MATTTTEEGTQATAGDHVKDLLEGFRTNDLLTYASAISFQIMTALVPGLLFVFGLMGFFGLEGVWRDDVRPTFADQVSRSVLNIVDDTVGNVLGQQQLFWVTFGAALAAWQLSGAVRATMGALNNIYGTEEERGWKERFGVSIALAAALGVLLIVVVGELTLLPLVDGDPGLTVSFLLGAGRWVTAAVLLLVGVGLIVHFCPNRSQSLGWVTVGAVLVSVGWTLMSLGFFAYLTEVASYGTVFGNLATLVVLLGYLYVSVVVFLGGLQLDALLRERHGEQRPGETLDET